MCWMKASKKTKSLSMPAAVKVGSDSVKVFVLEEETVGRKWVMTLFNVISLYLRCLATVSTESARCICSAHT